MNHTLLTLRRAVAADIEILTGISTAAFDAEIRSFAPADDEGPPGYNDPAHIARLIQSEEVYGLTADGTLIGWFWVKRDPGHVALHNFCIAPAQQGRGYGKQALRLMESLAPGLPWKLTTPHYSVRNHHLYQKAGYTKVGEAYDGFLWCFEKPAR